MHVANLPRVRALRAVLPVIHVVGFPQRRLLAVVAQVLVVRVDRRDPMPVRFVHESSFASKQPTALYLEWHTPKVKGSARLFSTRAKSARQALRRPLHDLRPAS